MTTVALYEKGKQQQWDAATRLDWSAEVDLADPLGLPEESIPIFGSGVWRALDATRRGEVRRHLAAWQFSQFLHGEEGALVCAAKLVQTHPDRDAKLFAATQVVDEARHVEVFSRYLREKLQLVYPLSPSMGTLLAQVVSDPRWDMTTLGMQVLIEGFALASFGLIRQHARAPLARALTTYVMQDEARHVAFGQLALRELYPQLTQHERDEREEFCLEAIHLMTDRFVDDEVWRRLGLDLDACVDFMRRSRQARTLHATLFSRVVPVLRDVGLYGEKLRRGLEQMGVSAATATADTERDE